MLVVEVVSDAFLALGYFAIPLTLLLVAAKRRDLPFRPLIVMFGVFIFASGAAHLFAVWAIGHPDSWAEGYVKAITAALSVATAIAFVRVMPKALTLRSPRELEIINRRLNERNDELAEAAFFDSLTTLPNRSLLFDRLEQIALAADRRSERFVVMYLDLDGFKAVNDVHGHACGDVVLQTIARRLRETVRDSDTVARLGGDEFVILAPHVVTMADAAELALSLLDAVARPIQLPGRERVRVSAGVGVACFPDDGTDGASLLLSADTALYDAKRAGGGSFRFAGLTSLSEIIQEGTIPSPPQVQ